jgi:hypothetical protein
MANRTGTYIAFDALGETNPTKSDFRFYSSIKAWSAGKHFDFRFVDSHQKTYAVRDASQRATLEGRIRERLAASKNVLVILSEKTRKSGSMLTYEIEQAVDKYQLPLLVAYTGYWRVTDPTGLSTRWPLALTHRINIGSAKALHIPFKKGAILDAITYFTVHSGKPFRSLEYYSEQAHIQLGCVGP